MIRSHALSACLAATLLAGCVTPSRAQSVADADLAITRVAVIDVERGRVVPDQSVLIKGNRIVAVGPSARTRLAAGVRTIDGNGKYLIPGLWDMHVHIGPDPARVEMPLFIAHGVTGVRVMGADRPSAVPEKTPGLDQHRQLQAAVSSGTVVGPRLMALGSWLVNGPAGISDAMPAFYKARTREEGQQLARYFKERGFDFVKVYNNLPRDGFFGLAEEANRLGLRFAGHEPGTLSALELSNAGQASIEHSRVFLFNCFAGADSLQKGLLQAASQTIRMRRMVDEYDAARCAEVFRTFAKNRTYITPTHVTRRMDAFADDSAYRRDARMRYIPLRQRVAWLEDADGMVASDSSAAGRKAFMDFYRKGLTLTNDAYRAGVPVMLGTDAGDSFVFPGASVHDELGELVKAGLSPAEALKAATMSGAEFLGNSTEFGSVAAGKYADLVLLDANPLTDIANARRIHGVVMNGRAFDRVQLDSMLAGVEVAIRPTPQVQLWAAASLGDTAGITQALAAGARIDSLDTQQTSSGRRALNYAALRNRAAAVQLLITRGATLDLANNTGFTPVHHAVEGGSREALSVLIAAGADVTKTTTGGARAVDMAKARGNQAMVSMLEAAAARRR